MIIEYTVVKNMTSTFNTNFKNMILIIGKAGTNDPKCPVNGILLGKLIDYMFNDLSNASKIAPKFKESVDRLDTIYGKPNSLATCIANKDRTLFNHIELFPASVKSEHEEAIVWFSKFLTSKMEDKHMEFVWRYLDKLREQVKYVQA